MIEHKKATKMCPLFTNWTNGTVTNKVTLRQEKLKFIKFGKKHIAYVPKRILEGCVINEI